MLCTNHFVGNLQAHNNCLIVVQYSTVQYSTAVASVDAVGLGVDSIHTYTGSKATRQCEYMINDQFL